MDRDRRALTGTAARLAAAAIPVAFLLVLFAYPVGTILARGLGDGFVGVVRRRSTGRIAWFTCWQAAASTALTLGVGLPAAWAVARGSLPGRRLVRAVVVVPFVLPTLVVGAALEAAFDRLGLDGRGGGLRLDRTVWAILLAHAVFNVAVVVRLVGGRWAALDRRPEDAARTLGAGRLRVLATVVAPRLAPAIWGAAGIVFLFCFTSFGILLTVGGPGHPTLETEIWRYATRRTDLATAASLAVVQLLAVVAMVVVVNGLERRAAEGVGADRGTGATGPREAGRGAWRDRALALLAAAPALALAAVPLVALVERSLAVGGGHGLAHYRALGRRTGSGLFVAPTEALAASLRTAAVAGVVALVVGGLAAAAVARSGRGWGGRSLDALLMIPLGTSAVTLGFGFLLALDRPPLDLRRSWLLVPLAQALVGIPFVVRTVLPALRAPDRRRRDAATALGAPPWRARLTADGPVIGRALLAGLGFAFVVSLGEFGATSVLARPDAPTVPVAMYRLLGRPGDSLRGQAMALATILAVVTAVVVLVVERLRPRDALGW